MLGRGHVNPSFIDDRRSPMVGGNARIPVKNQTADNVQASTPFLNPASSLLTAIACILPVILAYI